MKRFLIFINCHFMLCVNSISIVHINRLPLLQCMMLAGCSLVDCSCWLCFCCAAVLVSKECGDPLPSSFLSSPSLLTLNVATHFDTKIKCALVCSLQVGFSFRLKLSSADPYKYLPHQPPAYICRKTVFFVLLKFRLLLKFTKVKHWS